MDILADTGRQKQRYAHLKNLSASLCMQMQAKAVREGLTIRFSFDEEMLTQAFSLYIQRLGAFKRAADMTRSLANPVKIAALTSLCLQDRPCIQASPVEARSIMVYRHAWLALHAAAGILGIDMKSIDSAVRTELLQVLALLPWMEEERPEANPNDDDFHLSFERRLTILAALYGALRRQVPITVP